MSLFFLASMPVAFPDGQGERRRGINAPPENGQKKMKTRPNGSADTHSLKYSDSVNAMAAPDADPLVLQDDNGNGWISPAVV